MSNKDCKFAISAAYASIEHDPSTLFQELIVVILTVMTSALGLYSFCTVIVRHKLYKTKLLCSYYIFTFLLLTFRLFSYSILLSYQLGSFPKGDPFCDNSALSTFFADMPSYFYILGGMCQLFIVLQILTLWRLAYLRP